METTGQRIKKVFKESGLKQKHISEVTGISQKHISALKLDKAILTKKNALLLEFATHYNHVWLLSGYGDERI